MFVGKVFLDVLWILILKCGMGWLIEMILMLLLLGSVVFVLSELCLKCCVKNGFFGGLKVIVRVVFVSL